MSALQTKGGENSGALPTRDADVSPSVSGAQASADDRPFKLWGCGAVELHDSLWASRGVQVIRTGSGVKPDKDAALYLLLGVDQLVRFSLPEAVKRMHWLNPDILRLRIVSAGPMTYRERVISPDGSAFEGFRREYSVLGRDTSRAWLCRSASVASIWAEAGERREANQMMRDLARERPSAPLSTEGLVASASNERSFESWLRAAVGPEDRIDAPFGSVFELQEGVWTHVDAEVEPGAVLVAPLWIGAGARVGPEALLVGPAIVEDAADTSEKRPDVEWADMRSYRWALRPLRRRDWLRRFVKRVFDIAFSTFALILTAPVYPIAALAILIEDGRPIFFSHARQTRGGRDFGCIKFRTMVKNADEIKAKLQEANQADGPQFFMDEDPRILKVGRILRRFQIDELPQFVNVLLGHMSVVGPRPSPDKENQFCPTWREARLSVRPGVTGLWQVRRTRALDTDFQEWIRYDLEYVRHQSIWRDIGIIIETVWRIFRKPSEETPSSEAKGTTQ
ncbi:MAG: sugar transferase [Planctomycetota bacterium]